MSEDRKKLLELMEELSFPLSPEELIQNVQEMNDEDVAKLVLLYTDVASYERDLETYIKEEHPEEYKRLSDEREEILKKKDEEKLYDLERKQEEEDILLDSEDVKAEREIEEIVKEQESIADLVEGIVSDVEDAAKTAEKTAIE